MQMRDENAEKKSQKKSKKFQMKLNSTLSASSSSNIIKSNLKDFSKNYFRINYANECPNSPQKISIETKLKSQTTPFMTRPFKLNLNFSINLQQNFTPKVS